MNQLALFLPLLVMLDFSCSSARAARKVPCRATIDLHESLQIGDRVHTTSGLQGTITNISEDTSSWRSLPAWSPPG